MKNRRIKVLDDLSSWIGAWGAFAKISLAVICISLFALNSIATAQPNAKNVLIFFHGPTPVDDPAYVNQIETLLRVRLPGPVNFYNEHMDATLAGDEIYQRNMTAS